MACLEPRGGHAFKIHLYGGEGNTLRKILEGEIPERAIFAASLERQLLKDSNYLSHALLYLIFYHLYFWPQILSVSYQVFFLANSSIVLF